MTMIDPVIDRILDDIIWLQRTQESKCNWMTGKVTNQLRI